MPRALLPVPLATMATAVFLAVGAMLAVATPTEELLNTKDLFGTRSELRPKKRAHLGKGGQEGKLPKFDYYLDESDPDILILRRQDSSFVAAFSPQAATKEGIREAAMEDYRALVEAHMASLNSSASGEQQGT